MRARGLVFRTALVACVLVSAAFSSVARGATGDLDPTFSGDGKQTTDMPLGSSRAAATAIQPDGKIVVVGRDFAHGGGSAVARYNPNGSPDTSFSGDGKLTKQVGDGAAVALQADGKIVVVGGSAISRYNPDGSLDTSFSGDGNQTIANFANAGGVAIQDDGKIVVVGGTSGEGQSYDFALARYNPNGSLDTSFSGDGEQTTDLGGHRIAAQAVVLQGDGKIVAVGERHAAGGQLRPRPLQPQRLARHELLRRRQGDDRRSGFDDRAQGRGAPGDGKIVVVGGPSGQSRPVTSPSPATTRTGRSTRASPATASSAPTSGTSTRRPAWRSRATARSSQSDTPTSSVDHPDVAINGDFALARYNTNGSLDTSFSGDGKQTTDFFGTYFDCGGGGGAPGRRQDRRGRAGRPRWRRGLRPRPLQPQRLARHRLLRRR